MTPYQKSLEVIKQAFANRFNHFDLRLPDENLRDRQKGSLPYGCGGRLYYVFGREDGREYLEYYACHTLGDSHGRIWEDGTLESLPELCSGFGFDPKVPGDMERKEAAMHRQYQETLDDLIAKGIFDDEPVPGSLAVNSYLVLHGDDENNSSS